MTVGKESVYKEDRQARKLRMKELIFSNGGRVHDRYIMRGNGGLKACDGHVRRGSAKMRQETALLTSFLRISQALEPNATITNAALALCDRGRSLSGAEDVRRRDWCTFYGGTHRPTRLSL